MTDEKEGAGLRVEGVVHPKKCMWNACSIKIIGGSHLVIALAKRKCVYFIGLFLFLDVVWLSAW